MSPPRAAHADQSEFSPEADLLKVLAHPLRLRIVQTLVPRELTVKQIWTRLDISQAVASQQLAILKGRGVVSCRRERNTMVYHLESPIVRKMMAIFSEARRMRLVKPAE